MTSEVDKLDNIKKDKFIEFYRDPDNGGNISTICRAVGIGRATYYLWLEKDKKFREIMMDAKLEMCDDMEQVLVHRAIDKSDTALIFWLKYNHPTYKEQPTNLTQINAEKIEVTTLPIE